MRLQDVQINESGLEMSSQEVQADLRKPSAIVEEPHQEVTDLLNYSLTRKLYRCAVLTSDELSWACKLIDRLEDDRNFVPDSVQLARLRKLTQAVSLCGDRVVGNEMWFRSSP